LNVVSINLPPLRERRDEIPHLTDYFLKKYSVQYHKPHFEVSEETMRLFMEYDWPGNIRELENLIKRTVVLGCEAAIQKEITNAVATGHRVGPTRQSPPPMTAPGASVATQPSVPLSLPTPEATPTPTATVFASAEAGNCSLKDISRTAAREAEREVILKMLHHTRWNRKEAAESLGISYKALLYKIKENGLDKVS
jgi:two-component system response regulator AtoC